MLGWVNALNQLVKTLKDSVGVAFNADQASDVKETILER